MFNVAVKHTVTFSMLAFTAFASAGLASAKWGRTEWGMTPAQVEAAMPDTRPIKRGRLWDDNLRKKSEGRVNFYGVKIDASYYYRESSLELIVVELPGRKCKRVLKAIAEEYGEPVKIKDLGPDLSFVKMPVWHDEPYDNRLEFWPFGDTCYFLYSRLSTQRQNDLEGAP